MGRRRDLINMKVDRDLIGMALVDQVQHHKTYCDDINCHVYQMISRAVSEVLGKDLSIQNQEGEKTG